MLADSPTNHDAIYSFDTCDNYHSSTENIARGHERAEIYNYNGTAYLLLNL